MNGRDHDVGAPEGPSPPTGSLEAEGLPEVQGPPPGQPASADGDEGFVPPGDTPWVADDDLTATGQREGGTLEHRLEDEEPERAAPASERTIDEGIDLVDEDRPDDEPRLVGTSGEPIEGATAEEAAMHLVEEPPGAADDADDGYVAEDGGIAP